MACFSLAWIQSVLVWFIIIVAVIALVRLLLAAVLGAPLWPAWPPGSGMVVGPGVPGAQPAGLGRLAWVIIAAVDIVLWAVIAIAMVYILVALIGCLLSFAGSFPSFPGRRSDLGLLLASWS